MKQFMQHDHSNPKKSTKTMKKVLLATYLLAIFSIILILSLGNYSFIVFNDLMLIFDPYIFFIFNVMGIFPFLILIYTKIYHLNISKRNQMLYALGFLFGGFILYPAVYMTKINKSKTYKQIRLLNIIFVIISTFILILMFYIELFGDFSTYFNLFKHDIFVMIMSIDFIITYLLSIFLSYKQEKNWYISIIPVLGFLFLLNSREFVTHKKTLSL